MYAHKTISSSIDIHAKPAIVWKHITVVKLKEFSDPWYFKVLDIPKPLSAEIISSGVGGKRKDYFAKENMFIQKNNYLRQKCAVRVYV